MNTHDRIEWIDNIKTFACILVVLGHLIQSLQKSGIDNHENITNFINWFIYLFHMPLFFAVSGYLYELKKKKFSLKQYKKSIINKIINLGVPYISFYLFYVFINMAFANSVNSPKGINEIIGIINNPMAPYWFLYALFSIFLLMPLLEKILNNKKKMIFTFLLMLKFLNLFVNTGVYVIDSFLANSIYFYCGVVIKDLINRKKNIIKKHNFIYNLVFVLIYSITALILYLYNLNNSVNIAIKIIEIALALVAIFILVNMFRSLKKDFIFKELKKYTFPIYLLHTIFAAGFRIALLRVGITNYVINFIIGFVASIIIPIIIAKICEKTKYLNFFFYPTKTIKKLKTIKTNF